MEAYINADCAEKLSSKEGSHAPCFLDLALAEDAKASAPALQHESFTSKFETISIEAIKHIPSGIAQQIMKDLDHPAETITMVATATITGAVLKAVLPKTGTAGMITSVLLGSYFAYKSSGPFALAYKQTNQANNENDLESAGSRLGNLIGSRIADSIICAGGYRIGGIAANRILGLKSLQGLASAKQEFWSSADKYTDRMLGRH